MTRAQKLGLLVGALLGVGVLVVGLAIRRGASEPSPSRGGLSPDAGPSVQASQRESAVARGDAAPSPPKFLGQTVGDPSEGIRGRTVLTSLELDASGCPRGWTTRPVGGVEVRLFRELPPLPAEGFARRDPASVRSARSVGDGTFVFAGRPPPGTYEILVEDDRAEPKAVSAFVWVSERGVSPAHSEIVLQATPAPFTMVGRVLWKESRRPLAGALVRRGASSSPTDAAGVFRLRWEAETGLSPAVLVEVPGRPPMGWTVADYTRVQIELSEATRVLAGRAVILPGGKPASGVRITIPDPLHYGVTIRGREPGVLAESVCDSGGVFSFSGLWPLRYHLEVEGFHLVDDYKMYDLSEEAVDDAELGLLMLDRHLQVSVFAEDGTPVLQPVMVLAEARFGKPGPTIPDQQFSATLRPGQRTAHLRIPSAAGITLIVAASGYEGGESRTVPPEARSLHVTLRRAPVGAGSLRVRTIDAKTGSPLAAFAFARGSGFQRGAESVYESETVGDLSDGVRALGGLPDHPVDVIVVRGGYGPVLLGERRPGREGAAPTLDVPLERWDTVLRGTIRDARTGNVLSGVRVAAVPASLGELLADSPEIERLVAVCTGAISGPLGIEVAVPAGSFNLLAFRQDYHWQRLHGVMPGTPIDLRMERRLDVASVRILSFTVNDSITGEPLPKARIEWLDPGRSPLLEVSGPQHWLETTAGAEVFRIACPGYRSRVIRLPQEENLRVDLDLGEDR